MVAKNVKCRLVVQHLKLGLTLAGDKAEVSFVKFLVIFWCSEIALLPANDGTDGAGTFLNKANTQIGHRDSTAHNQ